MSSNIDGFLAQKYAILGQQAQAQTTQADAAAAEAAERTRLMAGNAYADQALRRAQAMQATEAAKMVAPLGMSEVNMRNTQTSLMPQQAASEMGLREAQTMAIPLAFPQGQQPANPARPGLGMGASPFVRNVTPVTGGGVGGATPVSTSGYNQNPTGYGGSSSYTDLNRKPGLATGGMVKGPGDGTVDTVDAKLANGEAVLNKGAAEHVGRPVIDALNFIGQMKMGMVPGNGGAKAGKGKKDSGNSAAEVPGYAEGTSWVDNANAAVDAAAARNGQAVQQPMPSNPGKPGYAKGCAKVGYAKGTAKAAPPKKGDSAPPQAKNDKAPAKGGGKEKVVQPPQPQIDPHALLAALHIGGMGAPGQEGGPPPQGMGMI